MREGSTGSSREQVFEPTILFRTLARFTRRENRLKQVRFISPVLGLLLVAATLLAPRVARAQSGGTIKETLGVSIAVGTVLGASTLPFYDQPGNHLKNLALGAGLGAVIGLGILAHQGLTGSDDANANATGFMNSTSLATQTRPQPPAERLAGWGESSRRAAPALSPVIWMPVVSLIW